MATQDGFVKIQVRLPADLHGKIKEAALESGRSMNGEIIYRLGESFSFLDGAGIFDFLEFVSYIEEQGRKQGINISFNINVE